MPREMNSFQDLLQEEFDIDNSVSEDDFDECQEMLDLVVTDYDERKCEEIESDIDDFLEAFQRETDEIIAIEEEEAMEELREFFDEDAEIFEESVDEYLDDEEEVADDYAEDEEDFEALDDIAELNDEEDL